MLSVRSMFIMLNVVTTRVIMLNLSVKNMFIMLNVALLSVIMLNVVMLSVVMLGVVAPKIGICLKLEVERSTKSCITMPCNVLVLGNFVNLALHQFDVSST